MLSGAHRLGLYVLPGPSILGTGKEVSPRADVADYSSGGLKLEASAWHRLCPRGPDFKCSAVLALGEKRSQGAGWRPRALRTQRE